MGCVSDTCELDEPCTADARSDHPGPFGTSFIERAGDDEARHSDLSQATVDRDRNALSGAAQAASESLSPIVHPLIVQPSTN